MTNAQKSALLGTQDIPTLLRRMALPAIMGMMIQALYNLIDTIVVGQGVGPDAVGALTVAFTGQMITLALSLMLGIGGAALLSIALGEHKHEQAAKIAGTALSFALILGSIYTMVSALFTTEILIAFGAPADLLQPATEYFSVIIWGYPFIFVGMVGSSILRAEGLAIKSMVIQLVGAGLNIILDPIFVFGLQTGIAGAAWATVISQVVTFIATIIFVFGKGRSVSIHLSNFIPRPKVAGKILSLGFPDFIRSVGGAFLLIIMNNSIVAIAPDDAAFYVSAFGMTQRTFIFLLMPIIGLAQGMQPIAGYNIGAKKLHRVRQVVMLTLRTSILVAAFAWVVFMLFPSQILSIFVSDPSFDIEAAVGVFRTVVIALPIIGFQVVGATYFQAVGKAGSALFFSLSRQFLFLIPFLLILPQFFGLNGVFASFPSADILSTVVTVAWFIRELKRSGVMGAKAPADLGTTDPAIADDTPPLPSEV